MTLTQVIKELAHAETPEQEARAQQEFDKWAQENPGKNEALNAPFEVAKWWSGGSILGDLAVWLIIAALLYLGWAWVNAGPDPFKGL